MKDLIMPKSKVYYWILLQGLSLAISCCAYLWILRLEMRGSVEFIPVFIALFTSALIITLIQKYLQGRAFWLELPTVFTIYIILALFVPTLTVYHSEVLKALLEWNDINILKAGALGLVFIHFLWFSYALGKVFIPTIPAVKTPKTISLGGIYILIGTSVMASFLAVITGTFGVLQNSNFEETANYLQYIDLLQQMGVLGLILMVFYHPQRKFTIALFVFILFLIGMLSAQKQAALVPFFALAIAYYSKTRRIPRKWIVVGGLALVITFSVVSMMREYYFGGKGSGVTSLSEVADISSNALNSHAFERTYATYDVGDQITMRLFYGNAVGKAIEHCKRNGYGVPDQSRLVHVLIAPVYALIPRFIYPDKPVADFGNWFARHIYVRAPVKYSIGITPVGYGYMVYGVFGVIMVAVIIGLFTSLLHNMLFERYLIIYLFVFIRAVLPSDVTWEYVSGCIKIIVVTWIVLKVFQIKWGILPTSNISEPAV